MEGKNSQSVNQFNQLFDSELLTKKDFAIIAQLKNEIVHTLKNAQIHCTRTELEVSVLNEIKHPTPESKYWQALRDQSIMIEELILLTFEYRKKVVEIKILEKKLKSEKDDLEKELIKIEIEKERYFLFAQERVAKSRIRVIKDWSEIKTREKAKMSETALVDVDNHQLISYTKRWIKQSIVMGNQGSPAERQNLFGQLCSGITACINFGILDKVLDDLPKDIQDKIKIEYGVN